MPEAPILSVPPHRRCHARAAACAVQRAALSVRRTRSCAREPACTPAQPAPPRIPTPHPPRIPHPRASRPRILHPHPPSASPICMSMRCRFPSQISGGATESGISVEERGREYAKAREGVRRRGRVCEGARRGETGRERGRPGAKGARPCARNDAEEVTESSRRPAARCALSAPSPPEWRRVRQPALSPLASPPR